MCVYVVNIPSVWRWRCTASFEIFVQYRVGVKDRVILLYYQDITYLLYAVQHFYCILYVYNGGRSSRLQRRSTVGNCL